MTNNRGYRSFEDFEREELHRLDASTVDEMLDASFVEDVDFSVAEATWFADDDDGF